MYTLLNKFNAVTEKEYKTYKENFMKRFEITELPPYLILYIKVSVYNDVLILYVHLLFYFFTEVYKEHILCGKKSHHS